MTCDLGDEELFIINLLYSKRNFKSDAGYHSDKLNKLFRKKFSKDAKDEKVPLNITFVTNQKHSRYLISMATP